VSSPAHQIDRICDDFESQWCAGSKPPAEAFLSQVEPVLQHRLLIELLGLEIDYRSRSDSPLNRDELQSRFPDRIDELTHLLDAGETLHRRADQTAPPQNPLRFAPNTPFGDYELLEEIGRGGMGLVFRARNLRLNRIVALKMIASQASASDETVGRFFAEAKAAAQLDHPGIVPIYYVGQVEGQQFYTMAYIEGSNLSDRVQSGPLEVREACQLMREVALAVQHAHDHGIVHRDLKPANVLLDINNRPRIVDFGLAKHLWGATDLTASGQIMGTPNYMSPEQASGVPRTMSATIDVYGLGAILYCLCTGRPPFQASSVAMTLNQVRELEPVSPRQLVPSIPRDVETICLKCLSKEPAARYASARDVADELTRFLESRPIVARPVPPLSRAIRWAKRRPAVAGWLAAFLVAVVGGMSFSVAFAAMARREATKQREARAEADRALQESTDVVAFLLDDMFQNVGPTLGGANVKVADLLDEAAAKAEQRFADYPQRLIHVLEMVGKAQSSLELDQKAVHTLQRAYELSAEHRGNTDPRTLDLASQLGMSLDLTGQTDRAEPLLRTTLAFQQKTLGENHADTVATKVRLGGFLQAGGQHAEARDLLESAIQELNAAPKLQIQAMSNLVGSYVAEGDLGRAKQYVEQMQETAKSGEPDIEAMTLARALYAVALFREERHEEVVQICRDALAEAEPVFLPSHGFICALKEQLSSSLAWLNRYEESAPILREAYQGNLLRLGENDFQIEKNVANLTRIYAALGRRDDELHFRKLTLISRLRNSGAYTDNTVAERLQEYLDLLNELHGDSAQDAFRVEMNAYVDAVPESDKRQGEVLVNWAWTMVNATEWPTRFDDAEPRLIAGLRRLQASTDDPDKVKWATELAVELYRRWGKPEKAASIAIPESGEVDSTR
jgi:Flp pilus assembly protein TadD/predicted Ser/Thr protein kinase